MLGFGICIGSVHAMEEQQRLLNPQLSNNNNSQTAQQHSLYQKLDNNNKVRSYGSINNQDKDIKAIMVHDPKTEHSDASQTDTNQQVPVTTVQPPWRAITALAVMEIPEYSPQVLNSMIGNLQEAYDTKKDAWREKYAKIIAGLAVSEGSLQQLHEDSTKHSLLTMSNELKNLVYYYMPQIWAERFQFEGSPGVVAFSPDKSKVVTECGYHMQMRDVQSGNILYRPYSNHLACSAAFSPDNKWLGIAYYPGFTKVIDVEKMEELYTIDGQSGLYAYQVKFSPDSEYIGIERDLNDNSIVGIVNRKTGKNLPRAEWNNVVRAKKHSWCITKECDSDVAKIKNTQSQETLRVKTGIIRLEFREKDCNFFYITPDDTVEIKTGTVLDARKMRYLVGTSSDKSMLVISNKKDAGMLVEQAATTFDQALFVKYLQWCRAQHKPIHPIQPGGWVKKVVDTYTDETVIKHLDSRLENDNSSSNCIIM